MSLSVGIVGLSNAGKSRQLGATIAAWRNRVAISGFVDKKIFPYN